MPNIVSVEPGGIIHIVLDGDQGDETVSQLITATFGLLQDLHKTRPDLPIRFLVDMEHGALFNLSARKTGVKALRTIDYQKIALVGASRFIKYTTDLVIMGSGQGNKIKQFKKEAPARKWLAQA